MKNDLNGSLLAVVIITAIVRTLVGSDIGLAATNVRTVPVPHGGQPVAAKNDSKGTIHLVFNSSKGPQYSTLSDDGDTFTNEIPIVDEQSQKSGLEFSPWDMAIGADDRIHVALSSNAWEQKRPKEEWAFYYSRLEPGATAFTATENINHTPSEGFSLAADDKGNVAACWLSGKLYANISRDNGESFGSTTEINPDIDPCDCCTTSCTYGADGKLAILYREETDNQRDMFLILCDQYEKKNSRARISTTLWKTDACPMTYFTVIRTPNGYVAAWPTRGQIYFARIDKGGVVQPPGEIKTSGSTGMRIGILALSNLTGQTLIAWKHGEQLMWQLYDAQGLPANDFGQVKSAGNGVAGVVDQHDNFVLFH